MLAYTSRNDATRSGVWTDSCLRVLLGDLVDPLPVGVLRGLNRLHAFATEEANKAPYRVGLPVRCFHDLSQRCAFGALHHCDDFSFPVGATRVRFASRRLGPACLLRGLRFLGGPLTLGSSIQLARESGCWSWPRMAPVKRSNVASECFMTFPIFTSLKAVSEDYLSYILQRVTPGPESACQGAHGTLGPEGFSESYRCADQHVG